MCIKRINNSASVFKSSGEGLSSTELACLVFVVSLKYYFPLIENQMGITIVSEKTLLNKYIQKLNKLYFLLFA